MSSFQCHHGRAVSGETLASRLTQERSCWQENPSPAGLCFSRELAAFNPQAECERDKPGRHQRCWYWVSGKWKCLTLMVVVVVVGVRLEEVSYPDGGYGGGGCQVNGSVLH